MKNDFIDTKKTEINGWCGSESHRGKQTLADVEDAVTGGGQGPTERRPRWRIQQNVVQAFVQLL